MATNVGDNRIFLATKDDGTTVPVRVRRATRRELEAADLEQSRIFNQALLSGLPPRNRLLRKLREQDLWTTGDDEKLNDLRGQSVRADAHIAEVNARIAEIRGEGDSALPLSDDDQKKLAAAEAERDEAIKGRQLVFRDLNAMRVEIDGMLGHTADAKADDAHRNFLLACVAEYVDPLPDGRAKVLGRVWNAVDNLMAEKDTGLLQRTVYEYMTFNAGLPSEWDKDNEAQEEVAGGKADAEPDGKAEPLATAA